MSGQKWKNARYLDASSSRCGLMVCCSCRKPVETGQFRVRETEDGFVVQHRSCSSHDTKWQSFDDNIKKQSERAVECEMDARAFIAKWGFTDLSDYVAAGDA